MMHAEVLPDRQMACLRTLGPAATELGFHLAGGTAVALAIGHRRSVDFDWFIQRFPGRSVDMRELLASRGVDLVPESLAERTVHGRVAGVNVSFLEFRPPLLEPLVEWPELGCRLASVADLAAMKLLAVTQRGTRKDFIDVLALSRILRLDRMLACYRRRFEVTDTSRVLAGLCYFDDADPEPMPTMLVPLDWETVKHELRALVRAAAGR
ncbi:MAG: nucleotidyl transferase AbiEii/AbiGii toxin family protein [Planctomycetia bacterium]|jgi:hypothetical protein